MGPADCLSSRPCKILWIVKCPERFWYFPGSFDCASFRLCMPVSFVDDSPLSPPLVSLVEREDFRTVSLHLFPGTFPGMPSEFLRFRLWRRFSCRLVPALSPAQGFLPVSCPGMFILHAGAFAARFACGGFGGLFPESSFFMHVLCCMAVFLKLAFGRILANLVTCN